MSRTTDHQADRAAPVTARRVFYIPGYDPIHPRRYRELYRKEGAVQAAISGYDLDLTARSGEGRYGWQVAARMDGAEVASEVDVLVWSDIVRTSMSQTIGATYLQLIRTAWTYIASGALLRLMRLRKGPVIAALYPVGFLLLQAVLAIPLAYCTYAAVSWGWNAALPYGAMGRVIGAALGIGAGYALLRWFKKRDGKFYAYYLMHDFAYSARYRGANSPALEARMAEFADDIAAALDGGSDEVLVVGHSSGAHLAVSILADLIRAGHVPTGGPALSFLSLGQVVPMVSFLPDAHRLRADLAYLSQSDALTWVDVTAPGDGCAFALCDPVSVSGVAPAGKRWPLVISAAFTQTLSPERWRALRWKFFRLHFQYLCAFDRPGDYDYFRITVGPMTLGQRYAGRAPSASRIELPVNKYTGMTP
ncbi:MAG TPA: alpha/beta hydrolase [Roseovarius sp.]